MLGGDWSEHWKTGGDEDHGSTVDGSRAMVRSHGGSSGQGSSGRGSFVQDNKSGNNTQKTKHTDGPGVAAVSKVSTFTGSSLGNIILPTFTASFIGPTESNLSVRALYDPGSQASYVREDVANTLNARVLEPDVTLCIKGFNSNKSLKTKLVQLSLSVGVKM